MVTQTKTIQVTTYKFSVAQFEQMISEGVFAEDDHIELLDGEIITMTPINHPHAATVSNLEFIFREQLGRTAYVWAQQPIILDNRSRPQPDIALLRWRDDRYMRKQPSAEDVLLVIEVAHASLTTDRSRKRSRYAKAGIGEYWIVNLHENVVEVYSNLVGDKYSSQRVATSGDMLSLSGGLEGVVSVDEIFGQSAIGG